MHFIKSIHAVDSHTMGEPTRVIVGGIPAVPGKTMAEKKEYLEKNMVSRCEEEKRRCIRARTGRPFSLRNGNKRKNGFSVQKRRTERTRRVYV